MIKLGATTYKDIFVKDVSGLYDFPAIKSDGNDWLGEDYIEALPRTLDYQYREKNITLDCFISAYNWSELETKIENIISGLIFDGLKMLVVPDYSVRGYMVRLKKTTIFRPLISFSEGKTVAEFKIVFEEPQPFNIQFSFYRIPSMDSNVKVRVSNPLKSLSFASDEQSYVKICFNGICTDVNLQQENYTMPYTGSLSYFEPHPFIITGDFDKVEYINVEILSGNLYIYGLNIASYFLRNGMII